MEHLYVQIKMFEVKESVKSARYKSQIIMQSILINDISYNIVLNGLENQIVFKNFTKLDVGYQFFHIKLWNSYITLSQVSQV